MTSADVFLETRWKGGDPATASQAWQFYLRALGDGLRAELAPFGLCLGQELQSYAIDTGSDVAQIASRVLEIIGRDLPDDLVFGLASVLREPKARPLLEQMVDAVRATGDKPLTSSALAGAICRQARAPQVPTLCDIAADPKIEPTARFTLAMSLKRRRHAYAQVRDTLERLRTDPVLGDEVNKLLAGKWRS